MQMNKLNNVDQDGDNNEPLGRKVGSCIHSLVEKVRGGVSQLLRPFVEPLVELLIEAKLLLSGLKQREIELLNASRRKYIDALGEALPLTILGGPGMAMCKDSDTFLLVSGIVISSAWFMITFEKVQKQLLKYGLNMTKQMLTATLTIVFLALSKSMGDAILGEEKAGSDAGTLEKLATYATIGVMCRCTWLFVRVILQYDIMDTFNNGLASLAQRYYENALSRLENNAKILKDPGLGNLAGRTFITESLTEYQAYTLELDKPLSGEVATGIKKLQTMDEGINDQEFYALAIDILKAIINSYLTTANREPIDNVTLKSRLSMGINKLEKLKTHLNKPNGYQKDYVHIVIATLLELLKDCTEFFQGSIKDDTK